MTISLPRAPWDKPPDMIRLVERLFEDRIKASDLKYVASAVLKMSDENAELRERVRALEMVVAGLVTRIGGLQ